VGRRLVLAVSLLAAASPSSAGTVAVRAVAGLGGIVKTDRSVPVRIVIDYSGPETTGELSVSWGDARITRRVVLASSGRQSFEVYLRSSEGEDAVHVRLSAPDAEPQSVNAPVRVLDQDEEVTLCIVSPGEDDTAGCSAALAADALPTSPRGYEAADHVIWLRDDVPLSPERGDALKQWSALRDLDRNGDLGVTPQPARPGLPPGLAAGSARLVTTLTGLYAAALLGIGLAVAVRREKAARAMVALTITIASGSAAAAALGRVGPGRSIRVHHSSLMQQIPGTGASVLTTRAIAVFPSADTFQLELAANDATLEVATASGRAEQELTDEGHPLLSGRFGLGGRQSFAVEAIVAMHPLDVTIEGTAVRATNVGNAPLYDCSFGDGFSARTVGTLPPGASVTAELVADGIGPVVTCTLPDMALPMVNARYPVERIGATTVVAYALPKPGDAGFVSAGQVP
jgi:hypothetical protein